MPTGEAGMEEVMPTGHPGVRGEPATGEGVANGAMALTTGREMALLTNESFQPTLTMALGRSVKATTEEAGKTEAIEEGARLEAEEELLGVIKIETTNSSNLHHLPMGPMEVTPQLLRDETAPSLQSLLKTLVLCTANLFT